MILHLAPAEEKDYKRFITRTADTDVVVLEVSCIQFVEAEEIWIAFRTGRNFRYIAAHDVAKSLGAEKAYVLPVFHVLTGCSTVSAFHTKGKKTAWDIWLAYDDVAVAFKLMMNWKQDFDDLDHIIHL